MAEVNAVGEKRESGCCGGPAPKDAGDACCVRDANAKAAGETGCGCVMAEPPAKTTSLVVACCR